MTSRDAMAADRERIPEGSTPKDLIFGDPDKIDDLVIKLLAYSGAFEEGRQQLGVLELKDWAGEGASAFEQATEQLPKDLDSAHDQFAKAAKALDAYADKLRSVHKRCLPIIADADTARGASKRYWKDVESYNSAVTRGDDPLPERPLENDPGTAAMNDCIGRLDKLVEELQGVIDSSKRRLDEAAKKAPDKPTGWDKAKQHGSDFVDGFGDALDGWLDLAEPLADGDFNGAAMQLAGMLDGAAYAAEHPKEFAKAAVNWDEWSRNPARAAGQMTPDLLLALVTGGAGALVRSGSVLKSAARRLADREHSLGRDGSARDRADSEPGKNDKCGTDRCTTGEPIDVATGEMVMSTVDVSLPGVLPLALKRSYVSRHTCGGWFGRTWAGTLDQRLELDGTGIVYVADDGMLLTYPVPEPGDATLPTSGPCWPLRWDGRPDGTMTITQPERGLTLHFAPLPIRSSGIAELALHAVTDRNGNWTAISYDSDGRPQEVSHSGGYRIGIDTDPVLLRITALRLLGTSDSEQSSSRHGTTLVSFGYTSAGDLAEVINSTGEALRYAYDAEHRITSWTDRNGTKFAYVYDHRGRILRTVGSDGMMSGRLHYNDSARTTVYTDSLGNRTVYVYNEAYKVISETDPLGNTTCTEWDETNRLPLAVTDPLGHTIRYTYDEAGNLIHVEQPDGTTASAAYNDLGQPLEVSAPDGGVWRHAYDARGNRVSTADPTGCDTLYSYDESSGHLTSITDALGQVTVFVNNAAGLPVAVTDPLGHTTTLRRGPHGRLISTVDALGHTTRQGWTIEGKPAWRERPDGARETWRWDGEGNLVEHTDEAGNTTCYTYTHFDLPVTRSDANGARYAFAYDTELRMTQVTNPLGATWTYEYDSAGRLASETDFNGRVLTYAHDAAGRLAVRTNGAGEALHITRDALGRITATRSGDGTRTTFAYDPAGRLTHAANADTKLHRQHDMAGRVLTETVDGRTSTYTYDRGGRRIARRTPTGLVSEWTYDSGSRPRSLTIGDNNLEFAYDAAGREISRTIGVDVVLTQSWDPLDRLTSQTLTGNSGTIDTLLQHRRYAYRDDGKLTEIRELTSGTRRFDLNAIGLVTTVRAHGWIESYAYDTAGNVTHAAAPGKISAGDREFTGTLIRRAGRTTYEHDEQGRLVRRTQRLLNGQKRTWVYSWNAEDRLAEAVGPDGERWRYTYDALGRRAAKQRLSDDGTPAEQTLFSWDAMRLAEQQTMDGCATTWDFAPDTHRPLVQVDHHGLLPQEETQQAESMDPFAELTQAEYDTRFQAIVTDLVGTPTELVTPDGHVAWQQRTTLWGAPLPAPENLASCPLRFPGQYLDEETGLSYNNQRYYDPATARYISPDPLGLAPAANHHAYVRNPFARIDPLGLQSCDEEDEGESISERDVHGRGRQTERGVDVKDVWDNGELYIQNDGQLVKILETGNGKFDIVVKDMSNPSGAPTTTMKDATQKYIDNQIEKGRWE